MKKIVTLAWTTFQELVRARFFAVGLVFAFILVALSYLLGNLSFEEEKRILFNLGTLGIEFVTLGLGIFAGSTLVSKEIELRTCQIVLTRPLSRHHFLLGKWSGLFLFITTILIGLGTLILLLGGKTFAKAPFFVIMLELGLKSIVIMTAVFLTSLYLRPVLSALIGISLYLLGHSLGDIRYFLKRGLGEAPAFFEVLEKAVPNFDTYNWKSYYFLEKGIPTGQTGIMITHMSAWIAFLLILSLLVWRKKDIG